MHDSSHTAYTKNHRMWGIVGRFTLDWFAGANLSSWHHQHVVGHHIYTNVAGVDPDLPINFENDMRRIVERQVRIKRKLLSVEHCYTYRMTRFYKIRCFPSVPLVIIQNRTYKSPMFLL